METGGRSGAGARAGGSGEQARSRDGAGDPLEELLAGLALDDGPGPARPLSDIEAAALVRRAVLRHAEAPVEDAPADAPADAPTTSEASAPAPRRWPWLPIGVGALTLALLGVLAPRHPPERSAPPLAEPAAPAPPSSVKLAEPTPVVVSSSNHPLPEGAAREPALLRPAPRGQAVQDLLRLANERRGALRFREADGLYQQVLRGAPRSDAAQVARLASAALRLEHLHDARGAVRLYQESLRARPRGSLALEAWRGLAEAHRALGDKSAEQAALRGLLAAQPDPESRAYAEGRLGALNR